MNCEYVNENYGVNACIGRRIIHMGNKGIIAADRGNYIGVNFDNDKPGKIANVHPTDGVEYGGMGRVRQMTRSQRNYQEYLDADWFGESFACWLGIEK